MKDYVFIRNHSQPFKSQLTSHATIWTSNHLWYKFSSKQSKPKVVEVTLFHLIYLVPECNCSESQPRPGTKYRGRIGGKFCVLFQNRESSVVVDILQLLLYF